MRVIVTRPQLSAARTAQRLEDLGHEPILLPLAEAVHDAAAAVDALAVPHSVLVVTSGEALRALVSLGAALEPHLSTLLFAVGKATARVATDLGFTDIRIGPGDGQGLARMLIESPPVAGLPVLYLAGSPRTPHLEAALAADGVPLRVAEVYRMPGIAYDAADIEEKIGVSAPDAVLLYSAQTARLFFHGPAANLPWLPRLRILAISDSLLEHVPPPYHANVEVAGSPDEDGLFALL
jgi:uroporphyrinogen-III synthase